MFDINSEEIKSSKIKMNQASENLASLIITVNSIMPPMNFTGTSNLDNIKQNITSVKQDLTEVEQWLNNTISAYNIEIGDSNTNSNNLALSGDLSTQTGRLNYIYDLLTQVYGCSDTGARAILANMLHENTDLNPTLSNGHHIGLCQWSTLSSDGARADDLARFCTENDLDEHSIDGQVAFMMNEIRSKYDESYGNIYNQIINAEPEDFVNTTQNFCIFYEGAPDAIHEGIRRAYDQEKTAPALRELDSRPNKSTPVEVSLPDSPTVFPTVNEENTYNASDTVETLNVSTNDQPSMPNPQPIKSNQDKPTVRTTQSTVSTNNDRPSNPDDEIGFNRTVGTFYNPDTTPKPIQTPFTAPAGAFDAARNEVQNINTQTENVQPQNTNPFIGETRIDSNDLENLRLLTAAKIRGGGLTENEQLIQSELTSKYGSDLNGFIQNQVSKNSYRGTTFAEGDKKVQIYFDDI